MTGPIDAITAIHNAFRRDMTGIDLAAFRQARGQEGQKSALERFHFFNEVLVWHAHGEETGIFPLMEKAGLHLPPLSNEIREDLKEYLPLAGSIFGNPIDATSLMSREGISAILRRLGELSDIHMFVYHLGYHPVSHWGSPRLRSFVPLAIEGLLEAQRATGKPVLLALRPSPDLPGMKDFFAAQEAFVEAGFPVFHSLIKLAKAMSRLVAWNQARQP